MAQARLPLTVSPADAVLLLVTLLAAAGWLFSKAVLQFMPPLLFMALRFGLSGLLLLALARSQGQVLPQHGLRSCARGGCLLGVAMMFWISGLQLSSNLGVAAFISSLGIVLAPFAARLLFAVPLSRAAWGAMLCAGLGMACMSLRGDGTVHAADWLLLLAAAGQAAYLAANSRDMARLPVLLAIALQLLVAALWCLAGSVLLESWQAVSLLQGWLPLAASVLLATCLRFVLQGWGQGRMPVARSAFILLLEPVWTALLAAWWFGTGFAPQQWLGAALVLAALLLSRRRPRRPSSLPPPVPCGRTGQ
ncbi:DMT family transporter [Vogesella sp. LIG4]|uniref:DMT family transporter n=1 Tax=Vogesella sp. LIG4 TaxID=1192162 RepID=UPI00081FD96B|nr:DMT family transporter [Vogesella sp. LIG4]SCK22892.1 Threonine/homoserine efflux transporter RhtA [Vogesella sp. LIG4]